MPRKVQPGLVGGRALYTGKNAYASQAFENDARQKQLRGLAQLHLWGTNLTITTTSQRISWLPAYSSATFTTPFLRGFNLSTDGTTLYCVTPGTYRISLNIRIVASGPTGLTTATLNIVKQSQFNTFQLPVSGLPNTNLTSYASAPIVYDLVAGDAIIVTAVTANNTATIQAGSVSGTTETSGGTYLTIEQIDT